jgi:uncharacterized membrane protein YfcA
MPSGLWRWHREKRLLWGLGGLLFLGALPGILAGTALRCTWLREAASFRIFVGLVLLFLALGLLRDLLRIESLTLKAERAFLKTPRDRVQALLGHYSPRFLKFGFGGQSFTVSTPALLLLSLLVGLLGGVYGIGGAAVMAPILIGYFHLPVYVASGASMLAGWASAFFGLLSYTVFWPALSGESAIAPDLALGFLFGLGGLLGVYAGSALQRHLPSRALKLLLLILILIMAAQNLRG